jgi:Family of unknown function (DUF5906)
MKLTFLNADVALTKSYTKLADGTIQKSSYPNVWEVSSITEDCKDLATMQALIQKHAALNNCLLKGMVTRPLTKESRKDSTDRNAATDWLCLDIDGIELQFCATFTSKTGATSSVNIPTTVDSILSDMGLGDISYILQWSGSQGISSPAIRCHVFVMLAKPVSAPLIKQWLIQKNHEVPVLAAQMALTKTANALTWGLDVTACQSDKLIYIAPPVLKNIKNPLGKTPRISLVSKKLQCFDFDAAGTINSTAQNRALTDKRVLELRDLAGLPKRKLTYKTVGAFEVLSKPDECIATEIKQDRGFVYFNLNGGDSWAYYHPEDRPDYIFNFKGEPTYLTKELLPNYWEQLKSAACRTNSAGVTYLAFLDKQTSTYWRGTYDAAADDLKIYSAKTETMIRHFADANGMPLGDYIAEWDMEFNPHDNVRVDFANRTVNTFQLTEYMRAPVRKIIKCPPMIFRIIDHILKHDAEAVEHFINWLSFIAQERTRTRTAWVFQGIPGTGKGLLINRILRPLFGDAQTAVKRAGELSEKWTDFVAGKFIVFIDEIQSSALKDEAGVIANLKNFITEPTATVRMMNKNAFDVPNHTNWIFASNKPDPVSVDKDDRRFNVGPYQGVKFEPTDADLSLIPKELQDFHHFLMSYPVDKDQACAVLKNSARNDLIELSQTTSESTASALSEGRFSFFLDQLPTSDAYKTNLMSLNKVEEYRKVLHDVMQRARPVYPCNVSRDELYILFNFTVGGMNASPTTFTRFLGHRQIAIKPVHVEGKSVRGVQIAWADIGKFPDYLAEHFPELKLTKPRAKS